MSSDTLAQPAAGTEPQLLMDFWQKATGNPLGEKPIEHLSNWQWKLRGRPDQTIDERNLEWLEAQWRLQKLRPSLIMDAAVHPEEFARRLESFTRMRGIEAPETCLIVAIDGGPEFARACFQAHHNNCVSPEKLVEQKDGAFYEHVYWAIQSFGAVVIDQPLNGVIGHNTPGQSRIFQDGLVATNSGEDAVVRSLCAALNLRVLFESINQGEPSWRLRAHPRIVIAENWRSGVNCLPLVYRSEIIISPALWQHIPEMSRSMLLAAGLRIGPRPEVPSSPTAAELIRRRLQAP